MFFIDIMSNDLISLIDSKVPLSGSHSFKKRTFVYKQTVSDDLATGVIYSIQPTSFRGGGSPGTSAESTPNNKERASKNH